MRFALILAGCAHAAVPTAPTAIASDDASFDAGAEHVPATVTHPTTGAWPGIVMFAGSGPTDRDWNNPLLPGKNGSGKLIAEVLAKHGAVVLRFDKAPGGQNKLPFDQITWATNLAEGRAAIALLRARKDVDPKRIYVLGNSEGGLHALRVAQAEPGVRGVILLASEGRSMRDIVVTQIENQLKSTGTPMELLAPFAKGLDDFTAGATIDPAAVTPVPGLQALLTSFTYPPTAPLMRGLLGADPAKLAAAIPQPLLILNGEKDVQVDPELDAKRLAASAGTRGTLVLLPTANHVFKHEERPVATLKADMAAAQQTYNADDAVLDAEAVTAMTTWLDSH